MLGVKPPAHRCAAFIIQGKHIETHNTGECCGSPSVWAPRQLDFLKSPLFLLVDRHPFNLSLLHADLFRFHFGNLPEFDTDLLQRGLCYLGTKIITQQWKR